MVNLFNIEDAIMQKKLFKVDEISDLYVDSYLTDEHGNLIFVSFWGRDITINEFIARITLNDAEYGIRKFHLIDPDTGIEKSVHISNKDDLEKHTGRVTTKVFGDMVQGFIYEKMTIKPDYQSGKALILFVGDDEPDTWDLVKEVCHIPLIDHWKESLLETFSDQGNDTPWIKKLTGVGINAIRIEFDQESLEEVVSDQIQNGQLTAIRGVPAPDPVVLQFPNRQSTFSDEKDKKKQATKLDAIRAIKSMKGFIAAPQLEAISSGCRSEEKQWFFNKVVEMAKVIETMPKTYEQDGKGEDAIAFLHYFIGSCDWYITEKDSNDEQHQAFGLANLGYGSELGYIPITELMENKVELDMFYLPTTLKEVRKKLA